MAEELVFYGRVFWWFKIFPCHLKAAGCDSKPAQQRLSWTSTYTATVNKIGEGRGTFREHPYSGAPFIHCDTDDGGI